MEGKGWGLVVLLFLSLLLGHGNSGVVRCRGNEKEALLSFKRGLHEDPSNRLASWVGEDCCSGWVGVGCHNLTRQVLSLHLPTRQLSGNISNSLAELQQLQSLDLAGNDFGGAPIPDFLGSLSVLRYLDLSYAGLGSAIPPQLGNLSNLRYLDLSFNDLLKVGRGLDWISGLSSLQLLNLETLNLFDNKLHGPISSAISNLSSLRKLDLSSNPLTGEIPISIANLSNLQSLYIDHNSFTGIISGSHFANLQSLQSFTAAGNRDLNLRFNSTWIPPFQLTEINMSFTSFGPEFPTWLKSQKGLEYISLSNTRISHPMPTWISCFPNLLTLDLSHNYIPGNVPNSLSAYHIILNSNNLSGSLPHITSTVRSLDLSNNSINGSLFPFLCQMTTTDASLSILDLSRNRLSDVLPDCWMNWKHLRWVNLHSNNFTGQLPKSMNSLTFLFDLRLSKNRFFGNVSNFLKSWSALRVLDLNENNISGNIPGSKVKVLTQLAILLLRSNNLEGIIPSELCNLKPFKQWTHSSCPKLF